MEGLTVTTSAKVELSLFGNPTRVNQYSLKGDDSDKLGDGSLGKVLLCKDEDSTKYAMKTWSRTFLRKKGQLDSIMKEIELSSQLAHKNIIAVHEVINDPNIESLYLILEYCAGGEVMSWDVKKKRFFYNGKQVKIPTAKAMDFFSDVTEGLDYMHSHSVIHRDMKPLNILLDSSGTAKIADLGEAKKVDIENGRAMVNRIDSTRTFFSPEIWTSESTYDGIAADMWALGACLYCFVTGKLPFSEFDEEKLEEMIVNKEPSYKGIKNKEIKNILSELFTKDPEQRMTMESLKTALNSIKK
mmetsp:Transcript_4036/g.5085  ORF Transcript_4036/g.5085 Transcript_4036/m.5085 type:complete len:300 (-) Transcript_4036:437-1336(-)|eukprot:CAMPEP_0204844162 /NCGR_PEP_ID=MMETSP1347-20130617/30_1 /ASSEMBLY_ACC=CAM_ASM_000690 /TAXON_ID=215587 /ORGANISM="Aplanochytrium stocchinoi, Strain GSBS06" /LENGTH=299 /DNA_ID=CAMNT_0051983447 /DNA_START=173 /DNA_END=1072 /DNA_ORIENTATION=-